MSLSATATTHTLPAIVPAVTAGCRICGATNRLAAHRLHEVARCGHCRVPVTPLQATVAVETIEEFEALTRFATAPVVMEFGAQWCGPCRYLAPELERLAWSLAGRAIVATVDTDRLPEAALAHGVNSLPTLVLFREGREQSRVVGAMTAESIGRRLGVA